MIQLKKVLHLSTDDKFVDMALTTFNTFENVKNDLFVYSKNKELKFVKSEAKIVRNPNKMDKYAESYNLIIIHSLSPIWGSFILKIKKDIPVVWIGWGYDYYPIIGSQLYLKKTYELLSGSNKIDLLDKLKRKLKFFYVNNFGVDQRKVIERIDFFSPVLQTEYELVKKKFNSSIFPQYIEFNYGNLEEYFAKNLEDKRIEGQNILVGNSSTYSNNHIEVFDFLKEIDLKENKIICPLSYGNSKYGSYIEKKGVEYFGENFVTLKDFIPLEDYIRFIGSCRYVIMNHCRQQAYGNIVTLLYLGAKVFLRLENPLYVYLKSRGMNIYSIQDLECNNSFGNILNEDEILHNRDVLKSLLCKEKIMNHVNRILEIPGKI